ncbi:hemerythrin domain-containing protein [Agrococcus carbonis]|uniref:Hemerythrin HHE cation binding domain-containing protein n=1 Tax=Agrococcus carbonis TaxID=684552 RepID=A0A1H1KYA5_9MICO|nr:hemerythrin domain-containing protein [Agrococcus carbonis]SDR67253.1 Hemerythrin HHE cation binding domain-containing protein [Agrococcus carbonis]
MVQQLPSTGDGERPPPGAGCDTSELRIIHAIYREDFARAGELVRATPAADARRVRLIAGHLDALVEDLGVHHRLEDEHIWDRLEQRAPACRAHVGRMRDQHARIAELLERVREAVAAWRAAPSEPEALIDALERTRTVLIDHLGDEERDVVPVAARVMTQGEWDGIREAAMREGRPSTMMMIELDRVRRQFAAEGREAEFMEQLPQPVRLAFRLFGRRQADRRWRAIYGPR